MSDKIKKEAVKVTVETTDGREFEGYVHLDESERLQDFLNDERVFLPIHYIDSETLSYKVMQINKSNIAKIEETDQSEKAKFSDNIDTQEHNITIIKL